MEESVSFFVVHFLEVKHVRAFSGCVVLCCAVFAGGATSTSSSPPHSPSSNATSDGCAVPLLLALFCCFVCDVSFCVSLLLCVLWAVGCVGGITVRSIRWQGGTFLSESTCITRIGWPPMVLLSRLLRAAPKGLSPATQRINSCWSEGKACGGQVMNLAKFTKKAALS